MSASAAAQEGQFARVWQRFRRHRLALGSHMVYERNANYHRGPAKLRQFIYVNSGKPQFADPRVRRALTMATEMQKSIDDIYHGTWPRTLSYLEPAH